MQEEPLSYIYSSAAFYKEGFSKGDACTPKQRVLFGGLSISANNLNPFTTWILQFEMRYFLITIY